MYVIISLKSSDKWKKIHYWVIGILKAPFKLFKYLFEKVLGNEPTHNKNKIYSTSKKSLARIFEDQLRKI